MTNEKNKRTKNRAENGRKISEESPYARARGSNDQEIKLV